MKKNVEFVSYDGAFPNLCSGTLKLNIKGESVTFPSCCLCSGGSAGIDGNSDEYVTYGPWSVDVPEKYKEYADEITAVVNENIPYGCCGGCI